MSQTSVPANLTAAYSGMLADMGDNYVESKVSEESSAEMPFGVMLAEGSAVTGALLPAAADDALCGVLLHSHAYAKDTELGSTGVKPKASLSVMRKGYVWVAVEGAVTRGNVAYVRHTSDGASNTQTGKFRGDSDSDKAVEARGCIYRTSTSGAGFAIVEVDMAANRAVMGGPLP